MHGGCPRLRAQGGLTHGGRDPPGPDHPRSATALRQKFLGAHPTAKTQVRYFSWKAGAVLAMHLGEEVLAGASASATDLIRVPAAGRQLVRQGSSPAFTALRFFNKPRPVWPTSRRPESPKRFTAASPD